MSLGKWFLSASLLLAAGSFVFAADEPMAPAAPATQPTEAKPVKAKKLTEPWNMLKDLSPEQVSQIEKIHVDALEQTDKIKAKEKEDITALLTPQQVTELKVDEAKKALEAKERKAERKKESATTEPAK